MKEQLLAMIKVISDDEIVEASAAAMARFIKALEANGFSRDEAMQLLVAHGMGAKVGD